MVMLVVSVGTRPQSYSLVHSGCCQIDSTRKAKAEFIAEFCRRMGVLAGGWASVDEVADVVLFLASDLCARTRPESIKA
jgi:hypothetical protein